MHKKISLMLAEDQVMLRDALSTLLAMQADFELLASVADGQQALDLLLQYQPEILITDIEMPKLSGLDLAQAAHEVLPQCKIIMLTTFARSGYLQRAIKAGVSGYLLKDSPFEDLAQSIRKVADGGKVISPELALEPWAARNPLSHKECQALKLAGEGKSAGEIARSLHLSEGTVRNYLSIAISKLHASNRIEAARIAEEQGWL